ncbi:hypothetical protein KBD45_05160 [Candidatus Dojkabacteria bacterium]|nr:hypothetical protein [Candidatus Dojkabacteria bacterium]
MISYKKAASATEMIISLSLIGILICFWIYSIDVGKRLKQVDSILDENSIHDLKIGILAYEAFEEESLFPTNFNPGFYIICREDAANCITNDKYININKLLNDKYLSRIPNHSVYSDSISSGYVLHYSLQGEPVVLTTGDLEFIKRK